MADLTRSSAPPRQPPFREDCWTEEATATLVDVWGSRYLELSRGNLRQKDWQEVAHAVNARHGFTKKTHRTDVQSKNRVDTLKKKYKLEKAKVSHSNAAVPSSWPFFSRMDFLIGSSFNRNSNKSSSAKSSHSPPLTMPMDVPLGYRRTPAVATPPPPPPMILPQKRPMPFQDESYFRRNYSAMAAAAAAAEEEGDGDDEDGETEGEGEDAEGRGVEEEGEGEGGRTRLAKAIERFGEIYEKVESMKQRQMIELEKQRMQFAKDLEVQRMRLFMDTQVQMEKLKQAKLSGSSDDVYSQGHKEDKVDRKHMNCPVDYVYPSL